MRKPSPSRLNTYALIASLILLSLDVLLMTRPTVSAQSACPNIRPITQPFWEPNHPVTVVFQNDSNWSDDEIAVMRKGFDAWGAKSFSDGNNSGVEFVSFNRGPAPNKATNTHTLVVRRLAGHGNPSMYTVANAASGG